MGPSACRLGFATNENVDKFANESAQKETIDVNLNLSKAEDCSRWDKYFILIYLYSNVNDQR